MGAGGGGVSVRSDSLTFGVGVVSCVASCVVSCVAGQVGRLDHDHDVTLRVGQSSRDAEAGVDRSVITRIRAVARDGAIAALQASKPGKPRQSRAEASEAAQLRAEVARLQATIVEQAVEFLGHLEESVAIKPNAGPRLALTRYSAITSRPPRRSTRAASRVNADLSGA